MDDGTAVFIQLAHIGSISDEELEKISSTYARYLYGRGADIIFLPFVDVHSRTAAPFDRRLVSILGGVMDEGPAVGVGYS